jgi:hypothetical protein
MLTAPKPKPRDPVPSGSHVARLYQIVHIGTTEFEYMGETKKSDKIRLTFELCNEKKVFVEGEEEKPLAISREFGFSMHPKSKLRPFVEGMGGATMHDDEAANFDVETLLGMDCLLTVIHTEKNGNVYANIHNASPLPKGMKAPPMYNEKQLIDVNKSSEEAIAALPEFLRDKIYATEEWAARERHKRNMNDAGLNLPKEEPVVIDLGVDDEGFTGETIDIKQHRPNIVKEGPTI